MYQSRFTPAAPDLSALFPAPLIPGEWAVPDHQARHWIVAQWSHALGERDFFLAHDVPELRWLPLPFYPGHMLVEAAVRDAEGRLGAANMVIGPQGCVPIDGQSAQWHRFNQEQGLTLTDADQASLYLRFFCSAIRGEEGRFRLVTELDDSLFVPGAPDRAEAERELRDHVRPLRLEESEDGFVGEVLILYGGHAFIARFLVSRSWQVEMQDDEPVALDHGAALARESCLADLRWFG